MAENAPKVLMVCLGNICRSPMAEGLLRKRADERGIDVITDSAGTSDYHIGEAPDKRMQKTGSERNVTIDDLRGRQFQVSDYHQFDHIFVMDRSNYSNVIALASSEEDKRKVRLMMDLVHPGENIEVPDPYFGGEEGFNQVFDMLDKACHQLLDELEAK